MNEVKLSGVEPSLRDGSAAAKPQQESRQPEVMPKAVDTKQQLDKADEVIQKSAEQVEQGHKVQEQQLEAAVTKLNDYIQNVQRDLEFKTDDASGKTIVTVIDRKTSEVVRQIPDDVALTLAQNLQQDEPLSLFNIKA